MKINQDLKMFTQRLIEKIFKIQIFYKTKTIDEIYISNLNENPIIFDVGANEGQSVDRFKKIFPKSKIFSFEPLYFLEDKLKSQQIKYSNFNYYLFGFGDKNLKKDIYVNAQTGASSFFKLKNNSAWLSKRSKILGIKESDFKKEKITVELKKLDDFLSENKISHIDILKVDVQGYESNIFKGSEQSLINRVFQYIEVELIISGIYEMENSFYNIERYLVPSGYKLISIKRSNSDNIFEGHKFEFDLLYSINH